MQKLEKARGVECTAATKQNKTFQGAALVGSERGTDFLQAILGRHGIVLSCAGDMECGVRERQDFAAQVTVDVHKLLQRAREELVLRPH